MNLRKPPRLASWLLNRLGFPESNPPLAGDMLEEFQSGRSRAWYWRQTIGVIAARARNNARDSRDGLIAVFFGWFAQAIIAGILWRFHLPSPIPMFGVAFRIAIVPVPLIVGLTYGKSGLKRLRSAFNNCEDACLDRLCSVTERAATISRRILPSHLLVQVEDRHIVLAANICFVFLGNYCFFALWGRDSLPWFLATEIFCVVAIGFLILLRPPRFTR
jgi:hypothetical protein